MHMCRHVCRLVFRVPGILGTGLEKDGAVTSHVALAHHVYVACPRESA